MRWLRCVILASLVLSGTAVHVAAAEPPAAAATPAPAPGATTAAPTSDRSDDAPPLVAFLVPPVVLVALGWMGYIFWIIFHPKPGPDGPPPATRDDA